MGNENSAKRVGLCCVYVVVSGGMVEMEWESIWTISLHLLSRAISIVYDPCYAIWRKKTV